MAPVLPQRILKFLIRSTVTPIVLSMVIHSVDGQVANASEPSEEELTVRSFKILLVDGTVVDAISYMYFGNSVVLTLPDGKQVGYRRSDVVEDSLSGVPDARLTGTASGASQAPTPWVLRLNDPLPTRTPIPTQRSSRESLSEFAGSVDLNRSSSDTIVIVGEHKTREQLVAELAARLQKANPVKYEALLHFIDVAQSQSSKASSARSSLDRYVRACTGSVTTNSSTTASRTTTSDGAGLSQFGGVTQSQRFGGPSRWTRFWGQAQLQWSETERVNETHHTTSTTRNRDTPYCRALEGQVLDSFRGLDIVLAPAIKLARMDGVLDYELNAILANNGIAPVAFWELPE